MQTKVELHLGDGLALFYYTLRKHASSAKSVIRDQFLQLNELSNKLKGFQYNVSSFCGYAFTCTKALEVAGGQDTQAPEELVETLMTLPSAKFNSNIQSHCSACRINSTLLDIDMLTDLACPIYQTILLKKEWLVINDTKTGEVSMKRKSLDNVAVLLA
eukprot:5101203-Ditylum_brightwellii.AAC.1